MKASFLMLFCFFTITAGNVFPQQKELSLALNNVTLKKAISEIEKRSDYVFLITDEARRELDKKVTIRANKESIQTILESIFNDTDLVYMITERQVSVYRDPEFKTKESEEVALIEPEQQKKTITGTVEDASGEPIIGANVIEAGTTNGTVTDVDGKFSFNVANDATIHISYVGYFEQNISTTGKDVLNIVLIEDTKALDEVVVVGYGTQKKINLTGAVNQVTQERLEKSPFSNINKALQGVSPGLNITLNTKYGGEPGASMDFNIRGIGSLSGGSPYVLVDGLPMNINNVNPDDVESISVLKDASSAAIYGARATYGVILITTKSGTTDMKMKTTYSNHFSWGAPTTLPKGINSLVFADRMNIAAVNSGQNKLFSDETIERMRKYQADPENFPSMIPNPKDPNGWGYWTLANGNTDWYDVYFKDWTFSQNHNLNVSGGSKNASYFIGLGWNDEDGKLNYANEKYQRFNLTSNFSLKVTDWMTFSLRNKFTRSYKKFPQSSESVTDRTFIFGMLARNWPNYPIYTPNGDYAMDLNQVPALANGGFDKQYSTDLWVSPSLELKLTEDLKLKADFSYNSIASKRNNFRAIIQGFAVDGVTPVRHYAQKYNRIEQTSSYYEYYTSNAFFDFKKDINKHSFAAIVGGQAELSNDFSLLGWRRDLIAETVPSIKTSTGDKDVSDSMSHWSTLGAFARLTYNYAEKYLFEVNGRYDGSSRFERGKRWGFFPSASVGYNIWKENFWENSGINSFVNTLKLRASYGSLGNQNVANYLHVEVLPISTNLPWIMDGIRPNYTSVPSNTSLGLTWEEAKTTNIGFDAGFFDNKLLLVVDWFDRKTVNMFGPGETLPSVFGANVPLKNNATLKTNGIELTLNWRQSINRDFKYNLELVFSDNKSKVTQYNNPTNYIHGYYVGKTVGEMWGFESDGLFQTDQEVTGWADQSILYSKWSAGDVKYNDLDGDGKITRGMQTLEDHGDLKVIGNSIPRFFYGINFNCNYKRFDFDMFWQGIGRKDVWMGNYNPSFWGFQTAFSNSSLQKHNLDFWTADNPDAYFPKPYLTRENIKNHEVSDRYLQDAAYLRLKNIQFGYTLPESVSTRLKTENMRFYVNVENLVTFSKIMDSFDPEANSNDVNRGLVYPLSKSFYIGINITF